MKTHRIPTRTIAMTGMLSAVSTVLMFFSFSVPLMPSFIKLDFSELPALIAAFSMGPISGAVVCLVKNLINMLFSTTGCVGEFANFLLGIFFVIPAGVIYHYKKSRGGALIGAIAGALAMAVASVPVNYYITYPVYSLFMPMDVILDMYRAINPQVGTLWDALVWFNMPFTFIKALCSVVITFVTYNPFSPLIKGKHQPRPGREKGSIAFGAATLPFYKSTREKFCTERL